MTVTIYHHNTYERADRQHTAYKKTIYVRVSPFSSSSMVAATLSFSVVRVRSSTCMSTVVAVSAVSAVSAVPAVSAVSPVSAVSEVSAVSAVSGVFLRGQSL
jgi:predicted transcriptional regulator